MNNDLISREALKKAIKEKFDNFIPEGVYDEIDNAPTVEPERLQGEFAEKLKNRIEERVCKYCQMNKNCVLCEISRVFQIITLATKEQEEGVQNG